MNNEVTKFIIDGSEIEVVDTNARTTASSAELASNTNTSDITAIKATNIVKTCVYNSDTKTVTITSGTIGG